MFLCQCVDHSILCDPCRSFRASSKHGSEGAATSLVHAFNLIKDVQKTFKTREQEKKELEVRGEREVERERGKERKTFCFNCRAMWSKMHWC